VPGRQEMGYTDDSEHSFSSLLKSGFRVFGTAKRGAAEPRTEGRGYELFWKPESRSAQLAKRVVGSGIRWGGKNRVE
jgi:hypothetical protein